MVNLYFRNNYPNSVWVCYMYYSPARCGAYGNWGTRGWWQIDPGQTKLVWVGNTLNRYYSYYAKAADGSTAAYGRVGMRLIDTDNYGTYTMTLTRG